ncbi:MAG: tetratricopeptide repeat protein [Hyphomicrobiales bacterium]|nr:tetratricopeptide repeat protein [Hyphomicrobiales bacterium]
MSDGDFFREVDEAVRQDRLKTLWDRYGIFVLAAAVLLVAGVAGYRGWEYWQAERSAESGARFMEALQLTEDGKTDEALKAYQEVLEDGTGGYALLARFRLAAAAAKSGDKAGAVAAYDALAKDGSAGKIFQGLAKIQAATLRVDQADMGEMKDRLDGLTDAANPWRHSARELLGLAAHRTGDNAEAQRHFTDIMRDPEAPPNLRRRAEIMLALVVKADAPAANANAK